MKIAEDLMYEEQEQSKNLNFDENGNIQLDSHKKKKVETKNADSIKTEPLSRGEKQPIKSSTYNNKIVKKP